MKTFKIEIPEGYEIDKEKSTFERIVYKPVEVKLVKSWSELNQVKGYYISRAAEVSKAAFTSCCNSAKNIYPTEAQTKAGGILLPQLLQLRDHYRNGWVPNYGDRSLKFSINYINNTVATSTNSNMFCVFTFQNDMIRDVFLKNFKDMLEEYFKALI